MIEYGSYQWLNLHIIISKILTLAIRILSLIINIIFAFLIKKISIFAESENLQKNYF